MGSSTSDKTATRSASHAAVPPILTRSFSDPAELSESIPEMDGEYIQVSAGEFSGQVIRSQLGEVTLHQTYTSPEVIGEMALPRSALVLGTVIQRDGPLLVYGKPLEPRELFIPEGEFMRHGRGFAGAWIALSRTQVEATVSALLGVDQIRLPGGFVVEHEALARAYTATLAAHVKAMEKTPERFTDPAVRDAAEHALLSRALDFLVAACESERATEHTRFGKAEIVRRASEYFDAFGHERMSLAELARASGASARSLNYAFQDLFGVSPIRYFKLKRLGRARSQLQQMSPKRGAVKRAALSSGFTHLGRFSAEYHELFGELPSMTLREP